MQIIREMTTLKFWTHVFMYFLFYLEARPSLRPKSGVGLAKMFGLMQFGLRGCPQCARKLNLSFPRHPGLCKHISPPGGHLS